jgi:pyruvate kinase
MAREASGTLLTVMSDRCVIFAFTNNPKVQRRMALYRGVVALPIEFQPTEFATETKALELLLKHKLIDMGSTVCVVDAGKRSIWREASVQVTTCYV